MSADRPRMTRRAGKQACNVGSFLRWQSCIGLPSRAKLALSLPIKGPSFCLPDRNGAGRSPEDRSVFFQKRTDAPILRRLTAPPPSSGRGLNAAAEPPPSPQAKANTTFLHNPLPSGSSNLRRQARPFLICREAANTTCGPKGPAPLAAAPHSPSPPPKKPTG